VFGQAGAGNEVSSTRTTKPALWASNTSAYASMLSSAGKKVGPNVLLKVMSGDNISGQAPYYYQNAVTNTSGANNLLTSVVSSLVNAITGSTATNSVTKGASGNINTTLTGDFQFNGATGPDASNASGNMPKAYFTILFFDERFNYIEESSTSRRVATAGDGATALTLTNIKAPKNGYAYIYVSNESAEPVYFDNIQVTHEHKQIIEEDHYYSYGLKIAAISSKKLGDPSEVQLKNNYLYQSYYSEFDEDIAWNDFNLRSYDPQIGRFVNIDPYDQFASSYIGMGNNPINSIDPSGGFSLSSITGIKSGLANVAISAFGGTFVGAVVGFVADGDGLKGAAIGGSIGLLAGLRIEFGPAAGSLVQNTAEAILNREPPQNKYAQYASLAAFHSGKEGVFIHLVFESLTPEIYQHTVEAQAAGQPKILTYDSDKKAQNRRRKISPVQEVSNGQRENPVTNIHSLVQRKEVLIMVKPLQLEW
jgi:RHS repeat-associated protein